MEVDKNKYEKVQFYKKSTFWKFNSILELKDNDSSESAITDSDENY